MSVALEQLLAMPDSYTRLFLPSSMLMIYALPAPSTTPYPNSVLQLLVSMSAHFSTGSPMCDTGARKVQERREEARQLLGLGSLFIEA